MLFPAPARIARMWYTGLVKFLGIDPGLQLTGYGCVQGAGIDPALVEAGVFRLGASGSAPRDWDGDPSADARADLCARPRRSRGMIADRLVELDADINDLLGRLRPDVVAVEALFAHYKHPATAIAMGHARGVILLAVRKAGLRLVELRPNEVKKFLTGHGHASKAQMQGAVQMRLGLAAPPEPADVADAIAIALCAAARSTTEVLRER
jgi:crossover junction endodeoxyribonuclease RuvC